MARQFIYHMHGLSKAYAGGKKVLDNIHLQFYPDAKIGVILLAEGGHIAHLAFFGYPVEPMAKSTFYFVVGALLIVDIVQGRYQKKILAEEVRRG